MAKLLILANSDVGLYKFRRELVEELLKKHEVFISLPGGEYISELIELGCKFIDTPISRRGTNLITDFMLLVRYKKIIGQVKPDAVLTFTIKPNVYGGIICRRLKTPYIANITGLGTALENGGALQMMALFLYRMAMEKARCVFVQNEENFDFVTTKGIVRGRCRLIPGSGVNLDYFRPLDYPDDSSIEFLYISRIMKEKGIDQYLDAAEHIRDKYPNAKFHILGSCEGAYEDKLNEMHSRGIVKYHGMQSDVRKFHQISHCTIHPSYYPEGMSNVLLESAACGRPIITTSRSGCKEAVADGLNGFLVEQRNSRDLIEKIERFMKLDNESKKRMGLAGREKIAAEFDRKRVIEAYLSEIGEISIEQYI